MKMVPRIESEFGRSKRVCTKSYCIRPEYHDKKDLEAKKCYLSSPWPIEAAAPYQFSGMNQIIAYRRFIHNVNRTYQGLRS
jgi:hypothetical protein